MASGLYNSGLDTGRFACPITAGMVSESVGVVVLFKLLAIIMLAIYTVFMVWLTKIRSSRTHRHGKNA